MKIKRKPVNPTFNLFLEGKLLLTHVASLQNNEDRVQLKDMIPTKDLKKAILSSFVWDDEWLSNHLPDTVELCLIRPTPFPRARVFFPDIQGYGCMHVKLFLLEYSSHIRLVITSANLIEQDWCCTENIVFVQDFIITSKINRYPSFLFESIITILDDLKVEEECYSFLLQTIDSSKFKGNLIFSKNGVLENMGILQLGSLVQSNMDCSTKLSIEYVTSSLGSMDKKYLDFFSKTLHKTNIQDEFKILFPTYETVINNDFGEISASQIFLHEDQAKKLPELYRLESKFGTHLMHSKIIVARTDAGNGFYYAGSHNFSKAAWGYCKGKQIRACNYELGIVFFFPVLTQNFLIPYKTPTKYSLSDRPYTTK